MLAFGIRDDRGKDRRWILCEEPDLVPLLAHLVDRGDVHEPILDLRYLPVEPDLHGLDRLDGLLQPLGGVDGRDLPVVDDSNPVAGEVCLLDVVGGEEDGDPFAGELPDHPPDDEVGLDVEARGGLVHEEEPRVVDEPHREGEAPLHPLGEAVGKVVLPRKEIEGLQELLCPLVPSCPLHMVELGGEDEVLPGGQVIVHIGGLVDDPHVPPRLDGLPDDVVPEDPGGAACGERNSREDADGGGLAGAIRPQVPEGLPLGDREGDAVEGLDLAVPLREALHLDGRDGHRNSLGFSGRKRLRGGDGCDEARKGWTPLRINKKVRSVGADPPQGQEQDDHEGAEEDEHFPAYGKAHGC